MKIIKILTGLSLIIAGIIILHSCCEEEYIITSNGEMSAWELTDYKGRVSIDTIRGEFILGAHFSEQLVLNSRNNLFIKSAMATTCKETFLNKVLENSMKLTIDKSLFYDGDTLQTGYNLLSLDTSDIKLNVVYGWIDMRFTETFFEKTSIENGKCMFNFNAETNDSTQLSTEIELFIDLPEKTQRNSK
ncbi:MAG: hypothetical protein K9I68_02955 [Bacteroidales bacterium]|nr:hypothetical protein [Bacteroidales bacterium]MCF8336702.1 hypothetical protein [Bacteroidales bacterium]